MAPPLYKYNPSPIVLSKRDSPFSPFRSENRIDGIRYAVLPAPREESYSEDCLFIMV